MRRTLLIILLALSACKERHEPPLHTETGSGSAAVVSDAEKVAKGLADAEAKATKERARWTPELTAAVVALRDQDAKDTSVALTAILAGPHREPGNKVRDAARHPLETLTFFGIAPTQTVVEVGGGGWYTELLAPLLANRGKLVVVAPDAKEPAGKQSTVYGREADLFLAKSPEINANPKDTKDYPKGVWTLPPSYREGDTDRAKYAAIGESDRMTLKFKRL